MAKQTTNIVDELRRAIRQAEKAGTTRYVIAKQTGLSQAMLSRFMVAQNVPNMDTAQRIARAIGKRIILVDYT